jgi:hypothetical protein
VGRANVLPLPISPACRRRRDPKIGDAWFRPSGDGDALDDQANNAGAADATSCATGRWRLRLPDERFGLAGVVGAGHVFEFTLDLGGPQIGDSAEDHGCVLLVERVESSDQSDVDRD